MIKYVKVERVTVETAVIAVEAEDWMDGARICAEALGDCHHDLKRAEASVSFRTSAPADTFESAMARNTHP